MKTTLGPHTNTRYQKAAFEGDLDAATLMLREAQRRNDSVQIQAAESLFELMKILESPPQSSAWKRLCTLLENFASTSPEHLHRILSWITPAVDSWPSGLRIVPQSWCSEDFLPNIPPPKNQTSPQRQSAQQKLRDLAGALHIGISETIPSSEFTPAKIKVLESNQNVGTDLLQKYNSCLKYLILGRANYNNGFKIISPTFIAETLNLAPNISRLILHASDFKIWDYKKLFFPKLTYLKLLNPRGELFDLEKIARCAPNLQTLSIQGGPLQGITNLDALEKLECFSVKNCQNMAKLSIRHPTLKQLILQAHPAPKDPLQAQIGPFPEVRFFKCRLPLQDTRWLEGFPKLRHLDLKSPAPVIENLRHCPALQKLIIKGELRTLHFRPAVNKKPTVGDTLFTAGLTPERKYIDPSPIFPVLKHLDIRNCTQLESLSGLQHLPALQRLDFEGCRRLKSLNFLSEAPQIQYEKLNLSGMKEIKSVAGLEGQIHLREIVVRNIQSLILSLKLLPQLSILKIIRSCKTFGEKRFRNTNTTIPPLPFLEHLEISHRNRKRSINSLFLNLDQVPLLKVLVIRRSNVSLKNRFRRYEGQEEILAALAQIRR